MIKKSISYTSPKNIPKIYCSKSDLTNTSDNTKNTIDKIIAKDQDVNKKSLDKNKDSTKDLKKESK